MFAILASFVAAHIGVLIAGACTVGLFFYHLLVTTKLKGQVDDTKTELANTKADVAQAEVVASKQSQSNVEHAANVASEPVSEDRAALIDQLAALQATEKGDTK